MEPVKNHFLCRPAVVCLLAAVACLLWGSAAPIIKIGYEMLDIAQGDTWKIILFAGVRFSLAGLLVIAFSWISARKIVLPHRDSWGNVVKLSASQTVIHYMLFYIGVANTSGVHSAILTGAGSLWAILLACFVFRQEKMTAPKLIGCLLGFGGIVMMNLTGESAGMSLRGEGLLLISGLCSGMSSCQAKIYSKKENAVVLTGWQFLVGGLFMCACAMLCGARLTVKTPMAAAVLLYLGFLSAVAYSLWTTLIHYNSVSQVAVFGFMTPMFGVLLSAILLREFSQAFRPNVAAALLMVCTGIVLVNRFGNSAKKSQICAQNHEK